MTDAGSSSSSGCGANSGSKTSPSLAVNRGLSVALRRSCQPIADVFNDPDASGALPTALHTAFNTANCFHVDNYLELSSERKLSANSGTSG